MFPFQYLFLTNLNTHTVLLREMEHDKIKSNITSVKVSFNKETEIEVSILYLKTFIIAINSLQLSDSSVKVVHKLLPTTSVSIHQITFEELDQ